MYISNFHEHDWDFSNKQMDVWNNASEKVLYWNGIQFSLVLASSIRPFPRVAVFESHQEDMNNQDHENFIEYFVNVQLTLQGKMSNSLCCL